MCEDVKPQDETGWLIERTDMAQPTWFALTRPNLDGKDCWTHDANKAVRFCREQDAFEIVLMLNLTLKVNLIATEHMWISA